MSHLRVFHAGDSLNAIDLKTILNKHIRSASKWTLDDTTAFLVELRDQTSQSSLPEMKGFIITGANLGMRLVVPMCNKGKKVGTDDRKMVEATLKEAERATVVSSVAILVLSVVKFVVGVVANSIVLMTDGLHSFTDLVTNAASWLGLRAAQREPDDKFPYCYFKAESFSALFISLFIIVLSVNFLLEGVMALSTLPQLDYPVPSLTAAALSIITSVGLSRYLVRVGRRTNSDALVANGREKKVDVLASTAVFVTLILSFFEVRYVEGVVVILLSVVVLREGLGSLKEAVLSLMDVSPSKEVEKEVIKAIASVTGVEGFGNLKLRKAGPFIFGEVDVMVRKHASVVASRRIGQQIEKEAKKRTKPLHDLTVRVVPYTPENLLLAIPVEEEGDNPSISNHFGRAKLVLLVTTTEGEVSGMNFVENPFRKEKVRAGFKLAHYLVERGVDYVISQEMGEISFHVLRDHLTDVVVVEEGSTVGETVQRFLENELESADEPTKEGWEYTG